jgi:hypothetical protein
MANLPFSSTLVNGNKTGVNNLLLISYDFLLYSSLGSAYL